MKKSILIGSIVLLALISVGIYGYYQYNRRNSDLGDTPAAFKITAADLMKQFAENASQAGKKYTGKIIDVSGLLKEANVNGRYVTLILGEEGTLSSVRCSMDTVHSFNKEALKNGSTVTIRGHCTGYNSDDLLGSDIILNRCLIINMNANKQE